MSRFFLPDLNLSVDDTLPENILLTGEDAFHLSVSLRARIGDPVVVCSSEGVEVECKISSISGGKKDPVVFLLPLSIKKGETESPVSITLFQGMPKGKKTDTILQKCTELGVDRVVFVYTDRSVPSWDGEEKKLSRYTKICEEAAKQCGRGKLVQVEMLESLDQAVEEMKKSQCFFACYEEESDRSLKEILSQKDMLPLLFSLVLKADSPKEKCLFWRKMPFPPSLWENGFFVRKRRLPRFFPCFCMRMNCKNTPRQNA